MQFIHLVINNLCSPRLKVLAENSFQAKQFTCLHFWMVVRSGASGNTGSPGGSGATGATGGTGASGASGSVGATGSTGQSGASGSTGASGGQGATGQAGSSGATGREWENNYCNLPLRVQSIYAS